MQTLEVRPDTLRPEGFSTIMQVKPCVSTFARHADITISKTAQNNVGLNARSLAAHSLAAHLQRCHVHDYQPNVRAPSLIDHTKSIVKPTPNVVTASSGAFFLLSLSSRPRKVQSHKAVLPGSLQAQTVFMLARYGRCTSDFALPGWCGEMRWPRGGRFPFRLWRNDQGHRALGQGDARDVVFFFMSSCIRMLGFLQNLAPKNKKHEFMASSNFVRLLVEFVFSLFFWIVCGRNTACHSHTRSLHA